MPDIDRAICEGLDGWDRDDLDRLAGLLGAEAASETSTTTGADHGRLRRHRQAPRLGRMRPGAQDLAQGGANKSAMRAADVLAHVRAWLHAQATRGRSSWLVNSPVSIGACVRSRITVVVLVGAGSIGWICVAALQAPGRGGDVAHFGVQLAVAVLLAGVLQVIRDRREAGRRAARHALAEQVAPLAAARDTISASEQRYRNIFAASPVGIGLSDEHGRFVAANTALCRLLGRSEEELLGHSSAEFTHPDDLGSHRRAGEIIDAAEHGIALIEKRYLRPDGQQRWAWLTVTHTPGPAGQTWTLAHVQDVTDRELAEQALRDSEANLTAVARVIHRIQSGADARHTIIEAGLELADADHVCLVEPCPELPALRVSASSDPTLLDTLTPLRATSATVEVFRTGKAMFLPDPAEHPLVPPALLELTGARSIYLVPVGSQNSVTGVLMVTWMHRVPDLDDRRARAVTLLAAEAGVALRQSSLLAELEHLALTDPLSGAPNRRGWDHHLVHLLANARRTGEPLTVALADLDHFKAFNDTHGHRAGDRLLKDFASAGQAALRAVDTLARWGGEEFAIALPNCPTDRAAAVLDRVRHAVPDGQTCSIGYATWNGTETADQLIDRADRALYTAKHSGRNRTTPATPGHT
jgi:diguanylate cyclase (GGDEF)-like protein/PAS domain S-box-containing protein